MTILIRSVVLLSLSFFASFRSSSQSPDSLKAVQILSQQEKLNSSWDLLAYHSSYFQVIPTMDDSVFKSEATVWLNRKPQDTIFGAIFHIRGKDMNGDFDYFYDGTKTVDIRHARKEITLIDPYGFHNDPNNPARARMSFVPLLSRLQSPTLVADVFRDHPKVTCSANSQSWVVTLDYPQNQYNAFITDTLIFEKATGRLVHTGRNSRWNGTVSRATYDITDIHVQDARTKDSLFLTKTYADYHHEQRSHPSPPKADTMQWTGMQAPAFTCTTLDGRPLSLQEMKGKYVLLDFWESWCGYCILALPEIKRLSEKYRSQGLEVIGITTENEKGIASIVKANQLPYPNTKADPAILEKYHVEGRPWYVLIDRQGNILVYNDWQKITARLDQLFATQ